MCQAMSELLTLSIRDLETMKDDFADQYNMLFDCAKPRLLKQLKLKNLATKFYRNHHKNFTAQIKKLKEAQMLLNKEVVLNEQ